MGRVTERYEGMEKIYIRGREGMDKKRWDDKR